MDGLSIIYNYDNKPSVIMIEVSALDPKASYLIDEVAMLLQVEELTAAKKLKDEGRRYGSFKNREEILAQFKRLKALEVDTVVNDPRRCRIRFGEDF